MLTLQKILTKLLLISIALPQYVMSTEEEVQIEKEIKEGNIKELKGKELEEFKEEEKKEEEGIEEKKPNLKLDLSKLKEEKLTGIKVKKCSTKENKGTYAQFINFGEGVSQECGTIDDNIENAKETLKNAIDITIQKAPSQLKNIQGISMKEENIKELLEKYVESDSDEIGIAGGDIKENLKNDIIKYMILDEYIYTYSNQFDNLIKGEFPKNVTEDWNKIIDDYETLKNIIIALNDLNKNYMNAITKGEKKTGKSEKGHVIEENDLTKEEIDKKYGGMYASQKEKIDKTFKNIGIKETVGDEISDIEQTVSTLNKVFKPIDDAFHEIVSEKEDDKVEANLWNFYKLFSDKDVHGKVIYKYGNKEYKIRHRAALIASFFQKLSKSDFKNLRYSDLVSVGFRNTKERNKELKLGAAYWLNQVANWTKGNRAALFEDGELDYFAFVNSTKEKDEIVIVFAGSNSHYDWRQDFRIGTAFNKSGLVTHEGIGKMFEYFTLPNLNIFQKNVEAYYEKKKNKPKNIEITVTGHSLGGGLALMTAFYLKDNKFEETIKDIANPEQISFKVFTYASPAIMVEPSKKKFEEKIGNKNVYRVWMDGDPVAEYSQMKLINGTAKYHVGQDFHLMGLKDLENLTSYWGQSHQAETYLTHLKNLLEKSKGQEEEQEILKIFLKSSQLKGMKKLKQELDDFNSLFKNKKISVINITPELKDRLVEKSSPVSHEIKVPGKVEDVDIHSPRVKELDSPRFSNVKGDYLKSITPKIGGILQNKTIPIELFSNTSCKSENLDKMLKEASGKNNLSVPSKKLKELECQCTISKHVFLAPYSSTGRLFSYDVSASIIIETALKNGRCEQSYMNEISKEINSTVPFEMVEYLVKKVGLGDVWDKRKLYFKDKKVVSNPLDAFFRKPENKESKEIQLSEKEIKIEIKDLNITEEIKKSVKETVELMKNGGKKNIDSIKGNISELIKKYAKDKYDEKEIENIYNRFEKDFLRAYEELFKDEENAYKNSSSFNLLISKPKDSTEMIKEFFDTHKKDILDEANPEYPKQKLSEKDEKLEEMEEEKFEIDE